MTINEYDRIVNALKAQDMWCEIAWFDEDTNGISLSIEWGDWKHSHARLDYLMSQLGYTLTKEQVTEEDGSDTYSSVHYYIKTEVDESILHPKNNELRKRIERKALAKFKTDYGKWDKRLTRKGFRSYKITWNGCLLYIETTYKTGCKSGHSYNGNDFID